MNPRIKDNLFMETYTVKQKTLFEVLMCPLFSDFLLILSTFPNGHSCFDLTRTL